MLEALRAGSRGEVLRKGVASPSPPGRRSGGVL